MNGPQWQDGWLMVPYAGEELAAIEIGVNGIFTPAYRDWHPDGTRVVQIRVPREQAAGAHVAVRVNGAPHSEYPGRGARRHPPASHGVS